MNSQHLNIFFQLLQVAVGTCDKLTVCPSDKEWALLYAMCQRQSLVGIGFVAIQRLPSEQRPPLKQLAQWIHDSEKIKEKNAHLTEMCATVSKQLTHDGLWNCILKGQSNLVNYPEWLRDYRTPGDIDVWCAPIDKIEIAEGDDKGAEYVAYRGERAVIEYALMQARLHGIQESRKLGTQELSPSTSSGTDIETQKPEIRYHHTDMGHIFGDVEVEIHHRPSFMCSPLRNIRLRNWCRRYEGVSCDANTSTCSAQAVNDDANNTFPVPTPSFNAVYQLVHIYRHLFDEGIGLRQLLDYYFVLRTLHIEQGEMSDRTQSMAMWAESIGRGISTNEEIMHTMSKFGMKKFASAVMYVLKTVFAMPDEHLLCPPNEKEGKFLLREILMAGNFGKFDSRIKHGYGLWVMGYGFSLPQSLVHAIEKTKHNFRLIHHYPEEVLWEPVFRLYHYLWRKLSLWHY